jgi:Zn-dependent protease
VFAEPERTRFDLNFHLFGFPVRIHPWFWLASVILGANLLDNNHLEYFLIWVAVVFVSILVHELGHALAFRFFHTRSHIVLHAFGGLAIPWSALHGRGRRILVSLAGPGAGFLLFGILFGSNYYFAWANNFEKPLLIYLYESLIYVNFYWGLVNLLPVWPLDGGQVCGEICSHFSPRNGQQISIQISIVVAGVLCLYSLACVIHNPQIDEWLSELPSWFLPGSLWTAILFGVLAAQSYQLLQNVRWNDSHWER